MLVVARLWGRPIPLMWLTIHALLSSGNPEGTSSVSALAATVPVLRSLCKILIIISTDVVEHRTLTTIRMVTYLLLVPIGTIVRVAIVWVAIRISAMLASSLALKHVVWLLLLTG